MQKIFSLLLLSCISVISYTQTLQSILEISVSDFINDPQMQSATFGFYVADGQTGKMLFHKNGYTVLAPASTQKTFTSIAALDMLGSDYVYNTTVAYAGKLEAGVLKGDLIIKAAGDPTLGSWRYDGYKYADVKNKFIQIIHKAGIRRIDGNIIVDNASYSLQPLPGGWPYDDIGNYYGAGDWGLNWNENQFDLKIKPGSATGAQPQILGTEPALQNVTIINKMQTTQEEDTRLYFSPYSKIAFAEGTVPAGKSVVTASGAMPDPPKHFLGEVKKWLVQNNVLVQGQYLSAIDFVVSNKALPANLTDIGNISSPTLDKIEFWFMRKSINLYGEAFAKTIAYNQKGFGSTEDGVKIIKKFWNEKGIDLKELKMIDGSGLSPQNAVSAHAEVQALLYAQKQDYYKAFYESLPTYNDMKMKSGTIARCKGFAGYQTSNSGNKYVFSILVNNYDGSSYSLLPKMYKILDNLKKY